MVTIFSNAAQTIDIIMVIACLATVFGVTAAIYLMITDR